MNEESCPDCGSPLPADSPQALCPACLMRQALASRTMVVGDENAPVSPPPSPEEIADKFPQFEILECRGGTGVVYKARQKSLNRLVAIKILAPERVHETRFAERFAVPRLLLAGGSSRRAVEPVEASAFSRQLHERFTGIGEAFFRMMDTTAFRAAFPRQLRYWTLHCLLNALPSLVIALGWMELIQRPSATAAIFSAIATFILLYAVLTSLKGPLADKSHLLSRSLHLGARVRAGISVLSLFALTDRNHMTFTPDFWCGFAAVMGIDSLSRALGAEHLSLDRNHPESVGGFISIYATTMLEGLILSFLLLMISFFALIFVQAKDRRKAHASPG